MPQRMEVRIELNIYIPVFMAVLLTVAKRWKQPLSIDGGMDKQNVMPTYYGIVFRLKRKEILTHGAAWMNLEDFMLGDISQTPNDKCRVIPLT